MNAHNRNERNANPDPQHARQNPPTKVTLIYRCIQDLKLDPKNPRTHSREQIRQLARSIDVFGFNVPILIDANLKVVAGHGRLVACQLLGLNEVPTILLDHLTDEQARAFMIADNRLSETSAWDDLLLTEQLKELSELNLDFSLEQPASKWARSIYESKNLNLDPMARKIRQIRFRWSGHRSLRRATFGCSIRHWVMCASALEESAYSRLLEKSRAGDGFHGSPLQRTHRRECQRPGRDSPSRLHYG